MATLQQVGQHLPFALHAHLAPAGELVVVGNEAVHILRHLENNGPKNISLVWSMCVKIGDNKEETAVSATLIKPFDGILNPCCNKVLRQS